MGPRDWAGDWVRRRGLALRRPRKPLIPRDMAAGSWGPNPGAWGWGLAREVELQTPAAASLPHY
jgi:hypothetical protein